MTIQLARQPNIKSQRLPFRLPRGKTPTQAVEWLQHPDRLYILITNSALDEPPILICDDDIEWVPPKALVEAWHARAFRNKKDSLI
jgi:hypothetical protein